MVKSHTRKARSSTKKSRGHMGLKKLRGSFDHMEKFVEHLRPKAKHSFSDAVSAYKAEWHRVFKREISPADAESYLKFRFNLKGKKSMTRRSKMRGGAFSGALGGAPLDYQLRAGVNGAYGNFPSYQQEGLDRYYGSALSADCGKPNGFPTDGSAASQKGGGLLNGARFFTATTPPGIGQVAGSDFRGSVPYPSSDPVGQAALRTTPTSYITNAPMATWARSPLTDIYSSTARSP